MSQDKLCNLRTLRAALGKSQSEMALLLGVSVRAVQSYEQGWRPCPPYVQKLTGLLMFLQHRKANPDISPCWEVKNCDSEKREKCAAFQFGSGEFCWLVTGSNCNCDTTQPRSWQSKMVKCTKCPVMTSWLPAHGG